MKVHAADLMTLGNAVAGFLAILTLVEAAATGDALAKLNTVLALLALGIALDAMDGPVARRWGSQGIGGSLDVAADAITFCLLPALLLTLMYGPAAPIAVGSAATALFLAGIVRLALNDRVEGPYFRGIPTPWSAGIVGATVFAGAPAPFAIPAVVALAVLNLAPVPVPRSHGGYTWYGLALGAVAVAVAAILVLTAVPAWARWLPLALGIVVVAAAGWIGIRHAHRTPA